LGCGSWRSALAPSCPSCRWPCGRGAVDAVQCSGEREVALPREPRTPALPEIDVPPPDLDFVRRDLDSRVRPPRRAPQARSPSANELVENLGGNGRQRRVRHQSFPSAEHRDSSCYASHRKFLTPSFLRSTGVIHQYDLAA
jgi:hypothetical protein